MKCPGCGQPMVEKVVQDVTLDFCKGCGGMWFDAGELRAYLRDGTGTVAEQGIFLTREDLEREVRETRIAKNITRSVDVAGTIMAYAWDLPVYLVQGLLDLLNP